MADGVDFHQRVGENPEKRITISFIVNRILANYKRSAPLKRILCMPGMSAWDLKYFLKKTDADLVAIDSDKDVVAHLVDLFKDESRVQVVQASTIEFFDSYVGPQFDLMYLDYFSGFSHAVEQDITKILKNDLLLCGNGKTQSGKLLVNLYGGRTPKRSTIRCCDHVRDVCDFFDLEMPDISSSADSISLGLNSFLYKFKLAPIRMGRRGHKKPAYASVSCPSWFRYKTNSSQYMYSAYFGFRSKSSKRMGTCSWDKSWLTPNIREIPRTCIGPFNSYDVNAKDHLVQMILDFYNKNHYTPTRAELKIGHVGQSYGWTNLQRDAGLCPTVAATSSDTMGEVNRIIAREGFIDWSLLRKARISRKLPYKALANIVKESVGVGNLGVRKKKFATKPNDYQELIVLMAKFMNGKALRHERIWLKNNGYTVFLCRQRLQDYLVRVRPLRIANCLDVVDIEFDVNADLGNYVGREARLQERFIYVVKLHKENPKMSNRDIAEVVYGKRNRGNCVARFLKRAEKEGLLINGSAKIG